MSCGSRLQTRWACRQCGPRSVPTNSRQRSDPPKWIRCAPFLDREQGIPQWARDDVRVPRLEYTAICVSECGDRHYDCGCPAGENLAAAAGDDLSEQFIDVHL